MSGVRLSNGSPTLERTEPRVTEHPKPSACRSLFGSVDREQLSEDLQAHMRELEEAAAARWGFDFVHDAPLPDSRFEWEFVESGELPEFYRRPPRREPGGNRRCVRTLPSEEPVRCDGQAECFGPRKRPASDGTSPGRWSAAVSRVLFTSLAPLPEPCSHSKRSQAGPEEVSLGRAAERTPRKPT